MTQYCLSLHCQTKLGTDLEPNNMNMLEACKCCELGGKWAQVWRPAPAVSQIRASVGGEHGTLRFFGRYAPSE